MMANSKSISASGNGTSDPANLQSDSFDAELMIKADNEGTPASGDEITAYVLVTLGDPDADPDAADEFTTPGHATPVAILDTNTEDPAISNPIPIPPSAKAIKVYCENGASSNSITVSAQMRETDKDGNKTETQITWS